MSRSKAVFPDPPPFRARKSWKEELLEILFRENVSFPIFLPPSEHFEEFVKHIQEEKPKILFEEL